MESWEVNSCGNVRRSGQENEYNDDGTSGDDQFNRSTREMPFTRIGRSKRSVMS